ncbi:hypothetical protein GJAV_G00005450 [Gymnothorax javanicus]|nr:hypothetical protein GJAV_G00005450 [Gymnothorax javanicus]
MVGLVFIFVMERDLLMSTLLKVYHLEEETPALTFINNDVKSDVMSSEFTIDIQLTELGFPELFQDETRSKEAPTLPCPTVSSTPSNSHIDSSPSQDLHNDDVTAGHVLSVSNKTTKAGYSASMQKIPSQRSQNEDQSNVVAEIEGRPHTDAGPNAPGKDDKHKIGPEVRKNPEAAADLKHFGQFVGSLVGKSSEADGGGKQPRVNELGESPAAEALGDSEETDDSDVSEDEREEEDDDDEEEEEEEMASDASVDGLEKHRCRVCSLTLPSAFQLREHMHLHSGERPYRCAECGKQFCHLANYRAHLRSHANTASVRCRVCEATFETEESLAHHLENSHFEKEFYQCDFCKRIFTCLNECQRHVETHQWERPRHQCPQCDRHFRRRKSLTRHMERHAGKRSYLCTDCGQAYPHKTILFRHSFSHLGLLPYTCVRCLRHFRLASLYRKHVCEPQRIQCVACLGFFNSQQDFQRHKEETGCWGHQGAQERGDGIRCMECGQAFQHTEELKEHGSAHQRVLTCSECGKGFRSALLLMSHMGGHAGQRPCLCQRCGLGFPHQQGYDSHRKHCGRPPPAPVAAKKQKKESLIPGMPLAPEKVDTSPNGVWKLTLDKCPPPGSSLVMFLPVPTSALSSGQAESGASLTVGSLPAKELQALAPAVPAMVGSSPAGSDQGQSSVATSLPPAMVAGQPSAVGPHHSGMVGGVKPAITVQGEPSEAACQGSLPVPGTTLKLQISKATFVPVPQKLPETWEQSWIPQPLKDGAQPNGTAVGPSYLPKVTAQIVRAPGTGGLFGTAGAASTPPSKGLISSAGRNWTLALKEENLEEEVTKVGMIVAGEEKKHLGVVLPEVKMESGIMVESGVGGQKECMELVALKGGGKMCKPMHVKIEHGDTEMRLSSLKSSDISAVCVSGWMAPEGLGTGSGGPGVTLHEVKQEAIADEETRTECEEEDQDDAPSKKTTEAGRGEFESVEVEIRDEEVEGDQEANDEPHECVNCGKALLEADMVQHYMQHAVESNSPLHGSSPEIQHMSSPSSAPPSPMPRSSPSGSPPMTVPTKRELRPRKKP